VARDVGQELFQARTRGSSGYWHSVLRGFRPDDARACEEAVAAARRNPDRTLLSLLLARASYFQRLAGSYRRALATAEEGADAALEVGDAYEYLFCQYSRAQALLSRGGGGGWAGWAPQRGKWPNGTARGYGSCSSSSPRPPFICMRSTSSGLRNLREMPLAHRGRSRIRIVSSPL